MSALLPAVFNSLSTTVPHRERPQSLWVHQ